ncbi:hypothetical protein M0R45_005433 [Rubus argutus]|uniref:Receptor-like serine/threonine-protein kinase n=1 Tax=Rubus argutus TaxID=59490 RepID=A0AAW1YN55_RUBAR
MASISVIGVCLLCLCSLSEGAQQPHNSSQIAPGSFLFPLTHPSSWPSPSGKFAFGFYQQGSGFAVGIWLVVGTDQKTIVWTANRDDPPVASNSVLQLTRHGELVLINEQGQKKFIISNSNNAFVSFASMLDSGNFVLYNEKFQGIWESFNLPTDTILSDDGNLLLYPANTESGTTDAYWGFGASNLGIKYHLYLDATGLLVITNTTTGKDLKNDEHVINYEFEGHGYKNGTIYRATVDVDGNFRLYSHDSDDENGKLKPSVLKWSALIDPCDIYGFCGLNSYCTLYDDQPNCLCLPGSKYVDMDRTMLGCLRNYSEVECQGGKENTTRYQMSNMSNMMWGGIPYSEAETLMEECSKSCLEDCNCGAALFQGDRYCTKQALPLIYVRRYEEETNIAFFKVGMSTGTESNNQTDQIPIPVNPLMGVDNTSKKVIVQVLVITLGFIIFICVAIAISGFYIFKIRVLSYKRLTEVNGNLGLADEELALRVFSYNELKRATNGFKQELGKGSFGAVYKGALNKGKKLIAVKRLEKLVEEGEKEFRAEMQAIGRTHHKNLVRLLGYSAQDSKRLLVYEYMSNGSLADLLFKAEWHPAWDERVRIAVDVARGLLYLHEECKSPIIHCDIKPQNILMDEFWNAKISDFGLAKLLMPDQTRTFTGIRGTRGYLAPEWHKNTPISVKADVYSFGVVLLELVCCRRNLDVSVRAEEIMLSTWVYKCFVSRELHKLIVGGEEVNKKSLENMVKVALWCIQDEPALRPSMKSVVLMLQGITDISIPPCPTTMSM